MLTTDPNHKPNFDPIRERGNVPSEVVGGNSGVESSFDADTNGGRFFDADTNVEITGDGRW